MVGILVSKQQEQVRMLKSVLLTIKEPLKQKILIHLFLVGLTVLVI